MGITVKRENTKTLQNNFKTERKMKWIFILLSLFSLSSALGLDSPDSTYCGDHIKIDGRIYTTDIPGVLLWPTEWQQHHRQFPTWLSINATIKDSIIYIIGAEICIYNPQKKEEIFKNPIPLKIIFPKSDKDSIPSPKEYINELMLFHFSKDRTGSGVLLFERGKLTRYKLYEEYEDSTSNWSISNFPDDQVEFKYPESDSLFKHNHAVSVKYSDYPDIQNSEYQKLLRRLRPYYGENLWNTLFIDTTGIIEKRTPSWVEKLNLYLDSLKK